jgi:RNA polymerase sigma-70 factor, ECF subfamily
MDPPDVAPPPVVRPTIAQLFTEHVRFVWRILASHGVPSRELDDATQEVFLVAHRRELDWAPEQVPARAWLHAIAVRVAANHRRLAYHRHQPAGDGLEPPDRGQGMPDEVLERMRLLERLDQVLEGLDEKKRQVFVLYEIEELSMQEVADVVGCPIKTAYARLYAARDEVGAAFERSGR